MDIKSLSKNQAMSRMNGFIQSSGVQPGKTVTHNGGAVIHKTGTSQSGGQLDTLTIVGESLSEEKFYKRGDVLRHCFGTMMGQADQNCVEHK